MHQSVDLPDEPSIRFARLSTGEDVITEIVEIKEEKEEYYLFVNPLKVVYVSGEKAGSIHLSFIEWIFPRICTKQQFKIYPNDVITIAEVNEEMEEYYYEALIKFENYDSKNKKRIDFKEKIDLDPTSDQITDEEIEMLNQIMEQLKDSKRKLH